MLKIRDLIEKCFSPQVLIHSERKKEIDGQSLPREMLLWIFNSKNGYGYSIHDYIDSKF